MDRVFFNEKPLLMTLGLQLPGDAHGPFSLLFKHIIHGHVLRDGDLASRAFLSLTVGYLGVDRSSKCLKR